MRIVRKAAKTVTFDCIKRGEVFRFECGGLEETFVKMAPVRSPDHETELVAIDQDGEPVTFMDSDIVRPIEGYFQET